MLDINSGVIPAPLTKGYFSLWREKTIHKTETHSITRFSAVKKTKQNKTLKPKKANQPNKKACFRSYWVLRRLFRGPFMKVTSEIAQTCIRQAISRVSISRCHPHAALPRLTSSPTFMCLFVHIPSVMSNVHSFKHKILPCITKINIFHGGVVSVRFKRRMKVYVLSVNQYLI